MFRAMADRHERRSYAWGEREPDFLLKVDGENMGRVRLRAPNRTV